MRGRGGSARGRTRPTGGSHNERERILLIGRTTLALWEEMLLTAEGRLAPSLAMLMVLDGLNVGCIREKGNGGG